MAGEQAPPGPGHAVIPSRGRWPTDRQRPTRAIGDRSATRNRRSQLRATWTNTDPPSGRLAGLSADDPVLGGRLGRGHRAAQPAAAITQRAPTTKRRARQLALVTLAAAPVAAWALEQAAYRAEARDQASPASRRLRQGADFIRGAHAGAAGAILGADRRFTGWPDGQPSFGSNADRGPAAGQPPLNTDPLALTWGYP